MYGAPGIGPVREIGSNKGEGVWTPDAWNHNVVAWVHTHGHYVVPTNNLFSQADLNISDGWWVFAYVGTPAGTVRKYNPWNPIGIFDYSGLIDCGYQIWP